METDPVLKAGDLVLHIYFKCVKCGNIYESFDGYNLETDWKLIRLCEPCSPPSEG